MKHFFERRLDVARDFVMCLMMNGIHLRHHLVPGSRAILEKYMDDCAPLSREQFFAFPEAEVISSNNDSMLHWQSPVTTGFPENDRTHVDLYPCDKGWTAPTMFMLHALMSVSDTGYKQWAKRFNEQGWNACFIHLPYHYSRVPHGYFNGELAIGPDLVRTGEGLRQGVVELRQLMQYLRGRGCSGFGLWATSYGGWIGALLSFLETDLRFLTLMSPIVNIDHAIWESPAAIWVRSQLRKQGITREMVGRHWHLTSPMEGKPLCAPERVILSTGTHDITSRPSDVETLHKKWPGSELRLIPQGHYGYRIMPDMLERLIERGLFA